MGLSTIPGRSEVSTYEVLIGGESNSKYVQREIIITDILIFPFLKYWEFIKVSVQPFIKLYKKNQDPISYIGSNKLKFIHVKLYYLLFEHFQPL